MSAAKPERAWPSPNEPEPAGQVRVSGAVCGRAPGTANSSYHSWILFWPRQVERAAAQRGTSWANFRNAGSQSSATGSCAPPTSYFTVDCVLARRHLFI